MYIPKHFEGSEAEGREIMKAHSWALLTTADEAGAPLCTHLAMQWEDDGSPHGTLVGHMARANDHWKLFARGAPSLALFWGPHAYVSPTWYTPGPKVPTWNYVTVHAYGRPEVVAATPAVLMVLTKLAAQYEGTRRRRVGAGPPAARQCRRPDPAHRRLPHEARADRDQAEAQPEPRARGSSSRDRQARGERQPGLAGDGQVDEAGAACLSAAAIS